MKKNAPKSALPRLQRLSLSEIVAKAVTDAAFAQKLRDVLKLALQGDKAAQALLVKSVILRQEDLRTLGVDPKDEEFKGLVFGKCNNPRTTVPTIWLQTFVAFLR